MKVEQRKKIKDKFVVETLYQAHNSGDNSRFIMSDILIYRLLIPRNSRISKNSSERSASEFCSSCLIPQPFRISRLPHLF